MSRKPFDVVVHPDGEVEIVGSEIGQKRLPEEQAERKAIITKCGHVVRRLTRNEPLTGKVLEFALGVLNESRRHGASDEGILTNIADKLAAGQRLDEYELHLMLDVVLLHKRTGT